ncbi:hypothetical protein PA905_13250 [Planktothrix agardhii CCAP 1459/11A]|jgi:hypothetical protein|uniref:Uncharacterized protein n=1 Tax=Planktothrix agardhii CCAP 1459/11A TaxID=282420 RepID=A0A4P5ZBV0_PLAAG|nr:MULTISPECIES: hypothetical protein [Planktothrix]CAD5948543.1 hypothetical protein NO108_02770 [Planktothrix rubescens]CAD0229113.1 conserved hypothetical protein [Planktothrix agardhii]CAD5925923.1 hypothetical protein NO758_00967 [Planktothrix agardhii]CAD5962926.1 hypothetical protein NO365_03307 [Planktothrix agardhii]CAH2571033.1 hypothetical protein PRNO82_00424 [Planktothrix rubescens]
MTLSKTESRQLLERMIFDDELPRDWVQDVWDMSPILGENAAKLLDVFDMLIDCCSEEKLENLVESLYDEIENQ